MSSVYSDEQKCKLTQFNHHQIFGKQLLGTSANHWSYPPGLENLGFLEKISLKKNTLLYKEGQTQNYDPSTTYYRPTLRNGQRDVKTQKSRLNYEIKYIMY